VDSSKSEKRDKSQIKNPIELTVKKRHLDDDGLNKKRALFDMTKKSEANASPHIDQRVKKVSEPLSAAVFDYQKPDLKKKKTET